MPLLSLPGPAKGLLLRLLAAVAGTSMIGFIRMASESLHGLEIAFFRNLFALALLLPWYLPTHGWRLSPVGIRLHFIRAGFVLASMLSFFVSASMLPVAVVAALLLTTPLFATAGAAAFLGEAATRRTWVALGIGFAGAAVVVAPDPTALQTPLPPLGILLVLSAALFGAADILVLRRLAVRTSTWGTVVWMAVLLTPLSALPAGLVWKMPEPESLVWLGALAVAATLGQAAITRALYWSEVGPLMSFDFLKLLLAALMGWAFFHEALGPNTLAGGLLIVAGNVMVFRAAIRRSDPAVPPGPG